MSQDQRWQQQQHPESQQQSRGAGQQQRPESQQQSRGDGQQRPDDRQQQRGDSAQNGNGKGSGKALIECKDVVKAFSGNKVLDGVSCELPEKQISVVMGPSGTGKSVLLRHIVGLLKPDKGDVIVDGKHVPELNDDELLELRRQVGMLFQDGALFSSMNLFDNVAFPLRQHTKMSEKEIQDRVRERLKEVGLGGAEKKMPNELSGGMRKRAGFARALVMEPKILLFDEPDSGLDPVRTALLCELIKEIGDKYEATSLVISHDIQSCFEIADHIVLLHGGKVVDQGPKEKMKDSDNEFTQQFLKGQVDGPLGMD
jgi:phospholipid/cholesterol/gamma-HCH transport system ATP-binding protein